MSMSKISNPPVQVHSLAKCLGGFIFPFPEEIVYSFFNFLFDIFW